MKIYVSHSSWYDYQNELYYPIKKSGITKNHEFYFPHDDETKMTDTKKILPGFDLVLADVSFPTTGQGIELGWADYMSVPIVCICKKGNKYSSALPIITDSIIEYKDVEDMILKIKSLISANLKR